MRWAEVTVVNNLKENKAERLYIPVEYELVRRDDERIMNGCPFTVHLLELLVVIHQ
jgi:hypothetical protein